jgi:ATP/maltotriose-dependent transcriptional regulator MalT
MRFPASSCAVWRRVSTARDACPPDPRRCAVAVPGLVKPLSTREQEVLTLLAAGHPNRAIAEESGKLGVASRTQAVAGARQLGLLP